VAFAGAGLYEEALFRLALLPLVACGVRLIGFSRPASLVAAVALTSLMFAAAHHVGPEREALVLSTFTFRASAGAFFAAIFLFRGFGIAAGAHVAYDVFVGLT
jgi:membrane protease YdiL (CAAX protease family)